MVVLAALTALMALTAWGRFWKPVWIGILAAAGVAQHFMLGYGVVMDTAMLANTAQTDVREVRDLLGLGLFADIALVMLPAILVVIVPVKRTPWWPQLWKNAALFGGALALTGAAGFAMFGQLAPIVRSHMSLRYVVNPITGFASAAWIGLAPHFRKSAALLPITAGTARGPSFARGGKPPLLVIVVGETARADHFGVNGYERDTTPELARIEGLWSFRDVRSCGTDTRASVPCMFSPLGREAFERRRAESENLLDVLQAAGLAVLWLDNQAGCKEVCARVPTASTTDLPPATAARLCSDGECRDDALLEGLDARLAGLPAERRARGTVLVMHPMGSHGPAYSKRSAPAQKRFLPECTNASLGDCERAEVVNAYDNSIVATDHFLAGTIAWLQRRAVSNAAALLYMSDHGESLGELGIFLHGLPYAIAPEAQKQVAFVAWIDDATAARRGIDRGCVAARRDAPLSHDHLFHSVLGLLDVATPTYGAPLDVFATCVAR